VTHSREISPAPPAAFPVYGLDASSPGARWLDGFGDAVGDEVRWVCLAHQGTEPEALIMVETVSRPLTDGQAARSGEPALQSVAFSAAVVMVNVDLDQPLHPRAIAASSAARAGGEGLPPSRPDWHADQLGLMRD
jgi:hypothetical protein